MWCLKRELRYCVALKVFRWLDVFCSWDFITALIIVVVGKDLKCRLSGDGPAHIAIASDIVIVLPASSYSSSRDSLSSPQL